MMPAQLWGPFNHCRAMMVNARGQPLTLVFLGLVISCWFLCIAAVQMKNTICGHSWEFFKNCRNVWLQKYLFSKVLRSHFFVLPLLVHANIKPCCFFCLGCLTDCIQDLSLNVHIQACKSRI